MYNTSVLRFVGVASRLGDGRIPALLAAAFAIFGVVWGVWAVLLADLVRVLDLGPSQVGLALMTASLVAIPVMLAGGRLANAIGLRTMLLAGAVLLAASFVALASVAALRPFIAVLVVLGAGSGLYDLAINTVAVRHEQVTGALVLTPLHACFSGGGVVGALGAGALISGGFPFRYLYLLVGGALLIVALLSLGLSSQTVARVQSDFPPAGWYRPYRNALVLLLALAVALGFLGESAMEGWSAIYLRNALGLTALVGGTGVAAYHAAMTTGRLAATGLVARFGPWNVLLWAGAAASISTLVALATTIPYVIIVGFVGVGLSLAAVAPTALSIAGQSAPNRAAEASSIVITFGYAGFLIGPPLVGLLADGFGLRMALGAIALAGLAITLVARAAARGTQPVSVPRH